MEFILLDLLQHADTLPEEQKQKQLKHIEHLAEMIDIIMFGTTKEKVAEKTEESQLKELMQIINNQSDDMIFSSAITERLVWFIKFKYAKKKLQEYKWK